jgi:hypothetical protein
VNNPSGLTPAFDLKPESNPIEPNLRITAACARVLNRGPKGVRRKSRRRPMPFSGEYTQGIGVCDRCLALTAEVRQAVYARQSAPVRVK